MTGQEISKDRVNQCLYQMLGSEHLVNNWWKSPNWNWDLETPEQVWVRDPEEVARYIISYLQK